MSWLKKYGLLILNGFVRAIGIGGPEIKLLTSGSSEGPAIAATVDTLTLVAKEVTTVEAGFTAAFGQDAKTGPAKMAAIQPAVQQAMQQWFAANFPGTAKIHNQPLWLQGCQEVSQGMVDMLNSVENDPATTTLVKTSGQPAPAPAPSPVPPAV